MIGVIKFIYLAHFTLKADIAVNPSWVGKKLGVVPIYERKGKLGNGWIFPYQQLEMARQHAKDHGAVNLAIVEIVE